MNSIKSFNQFISNENQICESSKKYISSLKKLIKMSGDEFFLITLTKKRVVNEREYDVDIAWEMLKDIIKINKEDIFKSSDRIIGSHRVEEGTNRNSLENGGSAIEAYAKIVIATTMYGKKSEINKLKKNILKLSSKDVNVEIEEIE